MKRSDIESNNNINTNKIYVVPHTWIDAVKRHPLAEGLYFTDIGFFPNTKHHFRERPAGCEQTIFIYCLSGSGYCTIRGQKKKIGPNQLFTISPNVPHAYGSSKEAPWSILWIHVKGSNLCEFIPPNDQGMSIQEVPFEKQIKVSHLFEDIFSTLDNGFNFENLIYSYQVLLNILGVLFYQFNYNKLNMKNDGKSIEDSIKYMISSIGSRLTLEELARHSNLSPSHYSYLFKKHTGISPIDYFLRLKIQKACYYLDACDYRINEISQFLGFKDPFYFSRIFSGIMGLSPSDYRKNQKG